MDIQAMRDVDVTKVDPRTLIDIRQVKTDSNLSPQKRMEQFIQQIGNPYCYLDNGVVVQIGYADTPVSLQDRLVSYASSIDNAVGNL